MSPPRKDKERTKHNQLTSRGWSLACVSGDATSCSTLCHGRAQSSPRGSAGVQCLSCQHRILGQELLWWEALYRADRVGGALHNFGCFQHANTGRAWIPLLPECLALCECQASLSCCCVYHEGPKEKRSGQCSGGREGADVGLRATQQVLLGQKGLELSPCFVQPPGAALLYWSWLMSTHVLPQAGVATEEAQGAHGTGPKRRPGCQTPGVLQRAWTSVRSRKGAMLWMLPAYEYDWPRACLAGQREWLGCRATCPLPHTASHHLTPTLPWADIPSTLSYPLKALPGG